ncbi:FdhF/YdeP family oxidoreductase [Rhodocytophaga rosea]|uniref:FdhF/YdeP family oxidoreductase n=1 Tax=Rhodocytophaga rosea TaxID=2704465 RepID=A0A6C0GH04_9BACT|nr:FdhF/YdeP family oxidoreductase [Rhodocytophaga rosea]QHT67002.1 FdhF/YdeP family oxidoreductase [Rhodocytophaga rosea]
MKPATSKSLPTYSAAGFAALTSSLRHILHEKAVYPGVKALLRMNKPGGFDCPGCAWPDSKHPSVAEFCENGVKAVAAETTTKRVTAEFFNQYTVSELLQKDGYWLEQQGRLTQPMQYNSATDKYDPISWEKAFYTIGQTIQHLSHPDEAVFYTSGRTSNEAAFLYQLFGREVGTNNFPDCSNMCHESSGVALGESIGIGKGTVLLEDFQEAEAIFIFGQNPGTNHPRMLIELEKARQRGCEIVSFNPLKEIGLQRFTHPQKVIPTLLNKGSEISSLYLQPLIGGDFALLKGLIKVVLDAEAQQTGQLDWPFIKTHTTGFEQLKQDIEQTSWQEITTQSGLSQEEITAAATIYLKSNKTIICWAMGLTQHTHAVITIQQIVNLLLLKGNIGKPGAGVCPVRGHSNVQGDRTMGIVENPKKDFLADLERVFGFKPPQEPGYHTVEAIKAMHLGKVKIFVGMGGNFAAATPDTAFTENALRKCKLTVQISTKLNRSHLVTGEQALILPCLGRTEVDLQNGVPQKITVEDSMSMVHASEGKNQPASPHLLSEPAIVACMAIASLPHTTTDWNGLVSDYDRIRSKIEEVFPSFKNFNEKIKHPGGFHLRNSAREREWHTQTGKANFISAPLPEMELAPGQFRLMTIRSHDQYNTTIYGLDDRYRGIKGERKVVFIHQEDMAQAGLQAHDLVDIQSLDAQGTARRVTNFKLIPYDIPRGCTAAYFPETNALVSIDAVAHKSHTPVSKYIVVTLERSIR